jgi:hypothetical protein
MYKIHAGYFLLAFMFGITIVCLMHPKKEAIRKFPNPWNQETIFRDSSDACYMYDAKKTSCPQDKSAIKQQPLMEDFTHKKTVTIDETKNETKII